jgi:hypothetical protein
LGTVWLPDETIFFKWTVLLIFFEELVDIYFHTCRFCQAIRNLNTFKRWIFGDYIGSFSRLTRKTLHSQQIFIFWKSSNFWQLGKICKCENRCQQVVQTVSIICVQIQSFEKSTKALKILQGTGKYKFVKNLGCLINDVIGLNLVCLIKDVISLNLGYRIDDVIVSNLGA